MHSTIIQVQKQSPSVFGQFSQVSNNLGQFRFSIIRPHNDTHINVSNVSNLNWLLRSLFIQFQLGNPCSHLVVLAKLKLYSISSRSCRVKIAGLLGVWKCLLECQHWSPTKFAFANYNHCILWQTIFREGFTMKSENFAKHIFLKCPTNFFLRPKWHFTGVEDFNIEHWLEGYMSKITGTRGASIWNWVILSAKFCDVLAFS